MTAQKHAIRNDAASWQALGRVVPVMVIDDAERAVPLARALLAGGLQAIEVTLRTAAGLEAAKRIRAEVPEIFVGVGTVLEPAQLEAACDAGLHFAVSPGYTMELIATAQAAALPWLPGVATVSEALQVRAAGFSAAKLFPAREMGGAGTLKAWGAVLPDVAFCPTGGVTPDNLGDYLSLPNVFAVGGSWLAPRAAVEAGDWAKVEALAAAAKAVAEGAKADAPGEARG